ncbi:hypothetical protein Vadar_019122 [Vaccinium darrowii]|uniref:Uncharacterized protein n=1 Tax=Vaccinium darrowii TaxID=229202 RepID=A0ACB7XSC5_9ERIC|nr:hypothetical protein Vadar_019122 [Vaccinium darrowii]
MESERQKQEENSTNSAGTVQTSNATEIESTEDGDSTPENEIPQMSEPPGEEQEAKAVEPENNYVIDEDRDSTPKIEIPQMSEPPGEEQQGKAVEPENDYVIDEDGDSTPKTEIPQMSEPPGEKQKAKVIEPEKDYVIDVERDVGSSSGVGSESFRAEKVCRICHLSADNSSENSELIQLGCGCKEELGSSHLHCAETWFKHKGNRQCEICGSTAKNIPGIQDTRIFMVEWNQTRLTRRAADPSARPCQCRNSTCNLLLACLVLAFILPWFFRIDLS